MSDRTDPSANRPSGAPQGGNPWAEAQARRRAHVALQPGARSFRGAPLTIGLILFMTAIELWAQFSPGVRTNLIRDFAVTSAQVDGFLRGMLPLEQSYRLVSYGALHGFVLHLLFNMAALAMLGPPVERAFGALRFAVFFVIVTIGGAIGQWAWDVASDALNPNWSPRNYLIWLVGASGAVFGVLGAEVRLKMAGLRRAPPEVRARFPSPLSYAARVTFSVLLINVGISLLGIGISGAAHIGGYVIGLIAAAIMMPRPRRP